jgi:hypothetical protein
MGVEPTSSTPRPISDFDPERTLAFLRSVGDFRTLTADFIADVAVSLI